MKKNPVKKKTKPDVPDPEEKAGLMTMLNEAPDKALRELYDQIMGPNKEHRVAALGDLLRTMMIERKYG